MDERVRRAAGSVLAAGCLLAATACSSAGGGSSSAPSGSSSSSPAPAVYLALGDSVPFGYRGGEDAATYQDPTQFTGYPELLAEDLGLEVRNASCPGETTASFGDVTARSNGCENGRGTDSGYRTAFPLHVDYDARDQAQLDFALAELQRTEDVELVTLQLGANDGFLCQASTPDDCLSEVGEVARTVQTTIDAALRRVRGEGGYDGTVVVVTYYALDYSRPEAQAVQVLDGAITEAAQATGALVADGFAAFRPAAEAAGGSSVAAGLVLPDDVHPTDQGQRLLADAVRGVLPG